MPLDALMQAISDGDADEVNRLIGQGANVNSVRQTPHPRHFTTTTMSPLGWAASVSANHPEATSRRIIAGLLASGADATIAKAILFASTAWSIEQLAQAGAPVNVSMTDGNPREHGATALMFRAEASDLPSVDLLVGLGADGSLATTPGDTALDYAVRGDKTVKVEADVAIRVQLIQSISRTSPSMNALSQAMLSVAQIDLLERKTVIKPGPPPTQTTVYNRFPVSVRPILELLESLGGFLPGTVENGPERRNILMLMLANRAFRYEPYDELSWLCRRYGFSLIDHADSTGEPVLFHVFNPDRLYPRFLPELVKLVRLFIAYNANLNFRDNSGATVLHRIVRGACRPKGSVSPDPFPCDGGAGDAACVLFRQASDALVAAGADPKLTDFSGRTPGREARARPNCPFTHLPVRSLLMDHPAETLAEDESLTPVDEKESGPIGEMYGEELGELGESQQVVESIEVDALWLRQSDALVDPAAMHAERDAELLADALATEDPEATRLDPAVTPLYRDANQKYVGSPGHVDPFIRINPNNGRRSTVRQAQLYEQYIFYAFYEGPGPYPKANRPGKSKHEYGYAIDVIRSNDEVRLAGALSTSGWTQTVEDEGWHWEATGAPRYSALDTFIATEMDALSEQWALTLSSFYERRKESLVLLSELESLRLDLARAQKNADDLRQQLAQESAWLRNEENRLRLEYDEILSLDKQIVQLQFERANKRYTYCPNGQPYERCEHYDLKQRYDNELRQLDQAIVAMRTRRTQLAADYDTGRRELANRRQRYAIKEREWKVQLQQVNTLQGQVAAKRQQVTTKQNQMQAARTSSSSQLTIIAAKVAGWT